MWPIMLSKKVFCPVGNHVEFGYLVKGEVCTFICRECEWIFSWDVKGKLMKPVKLDLRKRETCDCGACQFRNERQYRNKLGL